MTNQYLTELFDSYYTKENMVKLICEKVEHCVKCGYSNINIYFKNKQLQHSTLVDINNELKNGSIDSRVSQKYNVDNDTCRFYIDVRIPQRPIIETFVTL